MILLPISLRTTNRSWDLGQNSAGPHSCAISGPGAYGYINHGDQDTTTVPESHRQTFNVAWHITSSQQAPSHIWAIWDVLPLIDLDPAEDTPSASEAHTVLLLFAVSKKRCLRS